MTVKATQKYLTPEKNRPNDRKPTFEQKTDPDPNRLPKVKPAGLYR
jgi:hypothetical protein